MALVRLLQACPIIAAAGASLGQRDAAHKPSALVNPVTSKVIQKAATSRRTPKGHDRVERHHLKRLGRPNIKTSAASFVLESGLCARDEIERADPMTDEEFDVITFDCYGTLIDWEGGIVRAFQDEAG